MKQNNKNTPLTPEELNELLGKPTSSNIPMDDFEREALEGYSEIGSLSKIKKLQEEIDLSISHRINEDSQHNIITRKQKIIRLSIAASLFLLVTLSVIIYKSSFFEKESIVAVKEVPSKMLPLEEAESKPTISNNELEVSKNAPDQSLKTIVPSNENAASIKKTAQLDEDKAQEQEVQPGNPVGSAASGAVSHDIAVPKEAEQLDDLSKHEEIAEKSVAKDKKEVFTKRKADKNDGDNFESKAAPASEAAKVKSNVPQSMGEGSKSDGLLSDESNDLKQRILDYYQKNKLETSELKGLYKIKVAVKSNGRLKVISIINTNIDNKVKQHIEDAITDIKNWSSADGKQKNSNSETEFDLKF